MATIVIDPGHGGATAVGGSSPNNAVGPTGLLEKSVTLDVGLRLAALLPGHTVALTRSTDVNLGLRDRALVARSRSADIFLSIHFNGWHVPTVQGTEVWTRGTHAASTTLADAVLDCLVRNLGHANRGVRSGNLGVLNPASHGASTARCLAEVSFMTEPAEETRLMTTAYLDRVARALCCGVEAYLLTLSGAQSMAMASGADWGFGSPLRRSSRSNGVASSRRDPDGYGSRRSRWGDGSDEEGEGAEDDTAAVEVGQSAFGLAAHDDSFCPVNEASTAGTDHFKLSEFRSKDGEDCPERFRGNLQTLMENLEVLRAEVGAPITVVSGYRSPSHNKKIGGAKKSRHMCGQAADIRVKGMDPSEVFQKIEELIAAKRMLQGGLSAYSSFTHYDVRGFEARWSGG